jgi:hypothetical protein
MMIAVANATMPTPITIAAMALVESALDEDVLPVLFEEDATVVFYLSVSEIRGSWRYRDHRGNDVRRRGWRCFSRS